MIISVILIVCGLFFVITSTIGILRFNDFYNKFHPAGILDALGVPLIMIGLIIRGGLSIISLKMLLMILAVWVTSSTASHAIAQAYYCKNKR